MAEIYVSLMYVVVVTCCLLCLLRGVYGVCYELFVVSVLFVFLKLVVYAFKTCFFLDHVYR